MSRPGAGLRVTVAGLRFARMRIVVLSRSRFLHTTRWLVAAAKARGHDVRVAAPLECTPIVEGGHPQLLHRGKLPYSADAVIARPGAQDWESCIGVLRLLESMGVPVLNTAESMLLARERFQCALALSRLAVPVPPAALAYQADTLASLVEKLGGPPVLLSPATRYDAAATWLESSAAVRAVGALAWPAGSRLVLQKLAMPQRVVRVFVAGSGASGAVVARTPWIVAGAKAGAKSDIDAATTKLAQRVVSGLGLGFGAVDIVETAAGHSVLGVDACPNLRGIQPEVRKSVLDAVIKRAEAIGVARIPV